MSVPMLMSWCPGKTPPAKCDPCQCAWSDIGDLLYDSDWIGDRSKAASRKTIIGIPRFLIAACKPHFAIVFYSHYNYAQITPMGDFGPWDGWANGGYFQPPGDMTVPIGASCEAHWTLLKNDGTEVPICSCGGSVVQCAPPYGPIYNTYPNCPIFYGVTGAWDGIHGWYTEMSGSANNFIRYTPLGYVSGYTHMDELDDSPEVTITMYVSYSGGGCSAPGFALDTNAAKGLALGAGYWAGSFYTLPTPA